MERADRFRKTTSRLALGIALVLGGTQAVHALGLGEARVDSFLNQPLDVRMRLLDASAEDLDSLTLNLAGSQDFERLGLSSNALALDLEISVERVGDAPVVRVRSNRPVTDPVVQLLLDARWSSGRLLREYTLFLDPATVEMRAPPPQTEPAPPATAPRTRAGESTAAPTTRPATTPAPARSRAPRAAAADGTYGPVASGETLWTIARNNLPAADVSMDQMLIAIVELNPRAFRDRNINWLLRGSVLQLPDAEQVRAIDREAAAAAVAAQNRAFERGAGSTQPVVSDAARAAPSTPSPARSEPGARAETDSTPRLALVPPEEGQDGAASDGGDAIAQVRRELARTEEELYALRQETRDYQERVRELEESLRERGEPGGVRDQELAELEQRLREAREENSELRQRVAAEPDATPVTEVGNQSGLAGWWAWIVGGLALLAAIIGGVWFGVRRRQNADVAATPPSAPTRPRPAPAKPVAPAPPKDPVDSAREVVAANPERLQSHLDLLETLAGEGREREFGVALEAMYDVVEDDSDPAWLRALDMAGRVVPGHSLVKGSSDWISDVTETDAQAERASDVAVDDESEVDDLMARLDADLDHAEEGDWLADADAGIDDDGSPSEVADEKLDAPRDATDARTEPGSDDDEGVIDFDALADEPATKPTDDETSSEDDLVIDWPEPGTGQTDAEGKPSPETAASGSAPDESDAGMEPEFEAESESPIDEASLADETEDIFAQGEDDVAVKLDLARAYISWNSADSARTLLDEILAEGNEAQREEARKLLSDLEGGASS